MNAAIFILMLYFTPNINLSVISYPNKFMLEKHQQCVKLKWEGDGYSCAKIYDKRKFTKLAWLSRAVTIFDSSMTYYRIKQEREEINIFVKPYAKNTILLFAIPFAVNELSIHLGKKKQNTWIQLISISFHGTAGVVSLIW